MISGQNESTPEMVGSGPACEPGDWLPALAVCPKCGHQVQLFRAGCGLVKCPRCSKRWARRAAERAGARTYGAFMAGASRHKPRHVTFELPWDEGEPLDWALVKEYAYSIGCTGGVLVVHPWRIEKAIELQWEALRDQKKTNLNRYEYAKLQGPGAFRWAPHVHALTYGKFERVRCGQEIFRYRNIRRLNSLHECEGVLTYLFSHTFIPEGKKKVYRYFGICSIRALKPEWSGNILESVRCEKCGAKMIHENSIEEVLHHHYMALGWHTVKTKGPP